MLVFDFVAGSKVAGSKVAGSKVAGSTVGRLDYWQDFQSNCPYSLLSCLQ